jgi:hypothetical protein
VLHHASEVAIWSGFVASTSQHAKAIFIMPGGNASLLARIQFAFTAGFHIGIPLSFVTGAERAYVHHIGAKNARQE